MTQRFLFVLSFLFAFMAIQPAQAQQHRKVLLTLSGGSPMPTAYSQSNSQSLLVSDLQGQSSMVVINNGCNMFVDVSSGTGAAAPSTTNYELYVPSGTALTLDDIFLAGAVYVRSATGSTCTSGDVEMFFYGRRI